MLGMQIKNLDVLAIVAIAVVLGLVAWRSGVGVRPTAVQPGTPMPAIDVDGWLNLPEGQSFDPTGKIVVVDLWATWCPPCRAEMPRLAKVAAQYRPLGVEFVGLTSETERDVPAIENFIASVPGFDWPVGYGAMEFWNALNIPGVPTLVVFGRDGRARWSSVGAGQPGLEAALDEALAADRPSSAADGEGAE